MSKNEVPFNEAKHWNLYIATGFAVVILCFFAYLYHFLHTHYTLSQSLNASNSLHHALIEIERRIETLTAPQPSDEIAAIQRELMPLAVEAKYHFQHAFLIDDAHFDDFTTQALSLETFIREQQRSTSLTLSEQVKVTLNLLRTIVDLPPNEVANYLSRPLRLSPLIKDIRLEEQITLNRLSHSAQNLKVSLFVTTAMLALSLMALWLFVSSKINRNRTPLPKSEARVSSKHREAEALLENEKRDFLNLMSHEFRGPISAIITALELIPNMKQQQGKLIQQAEQSCYRLLNLTNNLLDILSIGSEQDKHIDRVDLISLLDECIAPYSVQVRGKKVEFTMHCNHSVPRFIEGDATNLSKVIRNTLDNAVKFTPNGIIHVDITTRIKNKKVFLVIKVKDSGLGIADDIKPKIFERFFRGEQPLDHRFPGAGIGLTIVQKSIVQLGGSLSFTSQEGIGTEFVANIPITPLPDNAPPQPNTSNARFAIVDDLEISRLHIQNIITSEGFSARCFASGSDLLSLHDELLQYTAIFADLYMPGIDGLELTRTLHAIYGKRTPPIVVLSATPDIANVIANSQLEVWQSFVKPVDKNRIVDTLHHLAQPNKSAYQPVNHAKILVVEDEPINAQMLENMLICMGHSPKTVSNGNDAIILAREESYDAILLDINLPDISGLEVAKIIKEKKPNIPIVAITSNAHKDDRKASELAGIRYHLVKPVTFQELKNTLGLTLLKL
ncbi:response regulator [Alteromonas lipotrueae]|uniref:response regulator n=1 Tax=Alteromonas lipotrueae TaxID=2803814 RepID=UPI001C47FCF6|nr:response regulator [Alteromonas lipotrueae]